MKKFNSFLLTLLVLFCSLVAISCPNPTPEGYFLSTVELEGTNFESIRDTDNEFVVRLNNAIFKDTLNMTDYVTDWVTAPKIDGINYQVKAISRDFTEVHIRLVGEPTQSIPQTPLEVEIPSSYFKENPGNVPVNTKKSTIKINDQSIKFVASDTTISGERGTALTPTEITFTLENALFAPLEEGSSLSNWFHPVVDGLEYKAKNAVPQGGSNTLTVVVSGTPKVRKEDTFKITVEKSNLIVEKNLKTLMAQGELSYAIVYPETTASMSATVIDGVLDNPIEKTFDIVLSKGQFNKSVLNSKINPWIYNSDKTASGVINGLTYTITNISEDLKTATISVSGTLTKDDSITYPIDDEFAVVIPKTAILDQDTDVEVNTNGSHYHIQDTPKAMALFDTKLEIYAAKNGEVVNANGKINLNYGHFVDSIAIDTPITSWFKLENNATIDTVGLEAKVTSVSNKSGEKETSVLAFTLSGVATDIVDSLLSVTLAGDLYEPNATEASEKEDLVVNTLQSFLNVTDISIADTAPGNAIIDGETGSAITDAFITIKLDDDHKFTGLTELIGKENQISSWFYKKDGNDYKPFVITGLKYTLSEVTGNELKLKISGNAEKNADVSTYPITDGIVVMVSKDYIERNLKTVYVETKTSYNIGKSSVVKLDKDKISAFRNKSLSTNLILSIEDGKFDTAKITEKKDEIASWFTLNGEGSIADLTFALSGTPTTSSFVVSVSKNASTALADNDIQLSKIDVKVPSYAISGATRDKTMKEAITYDLRNYPTATVISGEDFNAAINALEKSYDYTIRLRNARFTNVSGAANVKTWFTGSPDLSYTVKTVTNTADQDINDASKAYSDIVITIKGTPTTAVSTNMAITIPTDNIEYYDTVSNVAKTSVTPTFTEQYKFEIVELSVAIDTTATFGENGIYASVGKGFYNNATGKNEFEIPLTLSNSGFKAIDTSTSLLPWFTESPDAPSSFLSYDFTGITANVKEAVKDGDKSLTIVLSGIPKANNSASNTKLMTLYIPKEYIMYELNNLKFVSSVNYNIKQKSFALEDEEGDTSFKIDGYNGLEIETKTFSIELSNAEFNHDIVKSNGDITDWVKKDSRNTAEFLSKFSRLEVKVVTASANNLTRATFTLNATTTSLVNTPFYFTIPKDHLKGEVFGIESSLENCTWNIIKEPTLTKVGSDNFIAAVNGEAKENQYTVSIANGLFNSTALSPFVDKDISAFFSNTVQGLSYTLKSIASDAKSIVVSISGIPTQIPDPSQNSIDFEISKTYITPSGVSYHPGAYTSSSVTLGTYNIYDVSAEVSETSAVVFGIVNQETSKDITINLRGGASFKALGATTDVSSWFKDASGNQRNIDGLTYKIKSDVAARSQSAIITISGKPTVIVDDTLYITIPYTAITNDLKTIVAEGRGAKYGIGNAVAEKSKIWAESEKTLHESQDITVTLNGLEFEDSVADLDSSTITSFFSYTKKGVTRSADDFSWLSYAFKELSTDKKSLTLSVSGTPEASSEGGEYSINITFPSTAIKNASMDVVVETDQNLIIQVVSRSPFTWNLYDSASFAKRNISESDTVKFSENKSLTKMADGTEVTFLDDEAALIATGTESEFSFAGLKRRGYKVAGLSKTIGGDIVYPASTFVHPNGSFYMFLTGDEVQNGNTQDYYVVWEPDTEMTTTSGLKAWTPTDTSNGGTVLPGTFSLSGISKLDDSIVTDKAKYTASDYLDYGVYNEVYLPVKGYNFAITGDDRGDYLTIPTSQLKESMMNEEMPSDFVIAEDVFTGYILETLRTWNNTLPSDKQFELPTYSDTLEAQPPIPEYDESTGVTSYNKVSYGITGTSTRDIAPVAPLDISYPLNYVSPTQVIVIANAMTAYYNAHTTGEKLTYAYATDFKPASEGSDTIVRKMKDAIHLISDTNSLYQDIYMNRDLTKHNGPACIEATGFRLPTGKEYHVASSIIPRSDYEDDTAIYDITKVWNEESSDPITYTYAGTLYPQQQLLNQVSGAKTPNSGATSLTDADCTEYSWYLNNATPDAEGKIYTHGFKKANGTIKDKKANNIGLYGMSGNVYQWVDTTYNSFMMKHSCGAISAKLDLLSSSNVTILSGNNTTKTNPQNGLRLARTIV